MSAVSGGGPAGAGAAGEVAPRDLHLEAAAQAEGGGGRLAGGPGEGEDPELPAEVAVVGREEQAVARDA